MVFPCFSGDFLILGLTKKAFGDFFLGFLSKSKKPCPPKDDWLKMWL